MSAIDDLPPLREVIRRHGLSAKKSLGQNFLLDLNLTARIARAAGPLDGVDVIEIGPGPGGLTRALLATSARRVIAIERDDRAIARARGDRRTLSRPPRNRRRRCPRLRPAPAHRRRARAHRRKPALQHRDRAAGRLADARAMAALVRSARADVPARGRRTHRRRPRLEELRTTVRACRLALPRRASCSTSPAAPSCPRPK